MPPSNSAPSAPAPAAVVPAAIGRLERVAPDRIWASDIDFASWLAGNLDELGEALDVTLTGGTTVDGAPVVVARAATGGTTTILTERGESTDAGFGQLLRQVVASEAERAIWICARPRNDHGASISWLNRAIEGRFVVVRVEVVTIGGSAAAPTFEVAVRPSRGDDPGVDAGPTPADVTPEPGRRADDWTSELEPEG